MEIRKLNTNEISEFSNLVEIFKQVFENDEALANNDQLSKLLSNPDFMVFVVVIDNNIVGGLTIYVLHRYLGTEPIAYIYDVGITPAYQGQGLGQSLIAHVCNYCKENGFEDAYVEAESEDIEAVKFYRKTKFTNELNATHFTFSFND
jgi:aminoglycoside 3-N-acetyltransferase I